LQISKSRFVRLVGKTAARGSSEPLQCAAHLFFNDNRAASHRTACRGECMNVLMLLHCIYSPHCLSPDAHFVA